MGFCRVSYALWLIGVALFNLHWTVFFDDFYLIASEQERRHIDLAQGVLFQLLGWEVSSEKGADFDAVARIRGVQIDLSESNIGVFTVCNVDARVKELVATIDHILSQRTLSAAEMRVLRVGWSLQKLKSSEGLQGYICNSWEDGSMQLATRRLTQN